MVISRLKIHFAFFLVKISLEFIPYLEIKQEDVLFSCSCYQTVLWGLCCDKPSRVEGGLKSWKGCWSLWGVGSCWDTIPAGAIGGRRKVGVISKMTSQRTDHIISRGWKARELVAVSRLWKMYLIFCQGPSCNYSFFSDMQIGYLGPVPRDALESEKLSSAPMDICALVSFIFLFICLN